MRRLGGYAALCEGVTLLVLLALYGTVLPRIGLDSPQAFYRPDVLSHAAVLELIAALDLPMAVGIAAVTLAMRQVLHSQAPILVAAMSVAGNISATLLLASAGIGWRGLAELASADPATAAATFPALVTIFSGIETVALFCLGGWLVLVSLAGWNEPAELPRLLNVLGILTGLLYVAVIVVPTQPLGPLLLIGWFAWLGIHLLRQKAHQPTRVENRRADEVAR